MSHRLHARTMCVGVSLPRVTATYSRLYHVVLHYITVFCVLMYANVYVYIYIYIYTYMYIYIYIERERERYLSLYIYIYIQREKETYKRVCMHE